MKVDKQSVDKVYNICRAILRSNSASGVLHAGSNNFPELWTRDFMYSSRALSSLGYNKIITNSFNLIVKNQLPNGQIPVLISFRPISPLKKFLHDNNIVKFQPKIYPRYRTIFNTLDIDSSALSIIYFQDFVNIIKNKDDLQNYFNYLWTAYHWLKKQDYNHDYIIDSTPFSGWEDSINITNFHINLADILLNNLGSIPKNYYINGSYLNVLAIKATESLLELAKMLNKTEEEKLLRIDLQKFRKAFFKCFWNGKYIIDFSSPDGGDLDSSINLLAIYYDIINEGRAKTIIKSISESKMNEPFPIKNKQGKLLYSRFSIWNKIFQTTAYHEDGYWLWVGALFIHALLKLDLEFEQDLQNLLNVILRYKTVYEVYNSNRMPLRGRFNWICEKDFSWSSAMVLELITKIKSL